MEAHRRALIARIDARRGAFASALPACRCAHRCAYPDPQAAGAN
jgi:hypothetical protein